MSSLLNKKNAWAELTEEFNSTGHYPPRTTTQLKKLWENIKSRRKGLLNEEKRSRFKTGGGSGSRDIPDDPELDGLGVDIEIGGAVDSDTARLSAGNPLVFQQGSPEPHEGYEEIVVDGEHYILNEVEYQEAEKTTISQPPKKRGRTSNLDESGSRVRRNEEFLEQSRELHSLKMDEQKKKNMLIDLQLELVKNQLDEEKMRNERAAELHELMKKENRLKIEILERDLQK
ncbi:hypothetical protein GE061_000870 [Apolygus lucorum]|uniref:Regulatory protein zeste n=1 Tax=Apolygus lucorum TaxID=248454 RepID=A0A6A4KIN9_APOLU|nr:hypothetical protein GE061_000870 [Apolygus lucorum]